MGVHREVSVWRGVGATILASRGRRATYATQRLAYARALEVPCSFPDLRDDEELRAAIHWTVRRHREALLSAPAGGQVVRALISVCVPCTTLRGWSRCSVTVTEVGFDLKGLVDDGRFDQWPLGRGHLPLRGAWYTTVMRRSWVVIFVAELLAGCAGRSTADEGGAQDDGSTTAATDSTGSDATNGSSTASPSTSGSGEGTTTQTSGSTSVDAESSGDSTTASDRGEGTETEGDGAVYTAHVIIGGLDRIEIRKQDFNADTCMWLRLVHPLMGGDYSVTTPMSWSVEQIAINDVATSCTAQNPAMFGAEGATGATGQVTFGMVGPSGFPCEIDIDVEAEFTGALPNIPPVANMTVSGLPVVDACP